MPQITFLPGSITVEMSEGALLLEAARLAGLFVETPCGGRGSCGKCRVRITSGEEGAKAENAQICQARVLSGPMVVELPRAAGKEGQFEQGLEHLAKYLPKKHAPFVKSVDVKVPPPALLDGLSDADRFAKVFFHAVECPKGELCQAVDLPLGILAILPDKLREADGEVRVFYDRTNGIARVVDVSFEKAYGASIDIGTTTVTLWLVDMEDGAVLAARTAYNSQMAYGLDVISRIQYAKKGLTELKARIVETINGLMLDACAAAGVPATRILSLSMAGNTTMTHLLLGINPDYIRLAPYTPAVFQPQAYTAGQLSLSACANAPVLFAPAVGSYVGGDITAGLLCTSLARDAGEMALFIDIGTNGELVLGNDEFIFACACSAGPAFEGGGIKHGVRASAGAIERIKIDPESGLAEVFTIGGASPTGICGSGIISVVAELFRNGLIDSAGKFTGRGMFACQGKNAEYALCEGITVGEADIGNFIRAKGAIFSACQTLLGSVGLTFHDVDTVYIAGGFGRFLDLEDARTVGLFPRLPDERFHFLGNTSAIGAYLTLVSEERRAKAREIAGKITYVDLSNEPEYMDHYVAAQFLPHTDGALFV